MGLQKDHILVKLENKSARVKGLSFHPKRRWLLVSLHNGSIQLWDYEEKTLLYKFEEHKGPVRGIDFHRHQPLFVSGGDDSKVKVWNYKSRRCLFTLDAHEDYIRTTFFHHEHPWILSCSDDQSIRIWNWQSRTRIAVLTGHTHYVMCAQFHPKSELILSASIDQTLRLWDITGLKMKNTTSSMPAKEEINTGLPEILIKADYSVESKEAHNSEINWCAFHPDPEKRLCLSTADDNFIKTWKTDSIYMYEQDTLRGHYNNVVCAIFHPREDIILSCSEDRSIRIWDLEKRSSLYVKGDERFWTLAAHPKENLFAAGHDTGFAIFKLARERPNFTIVNDLILFIRRHQLFKYNMKTKQEKVILNLEPKSRFDHYCNLSCYSFADNQTSYVLVSNEGKKDTSGRYHHIYKISDTGFKATKGEGTNALFVGPNSYTVQSRTGQVSILSINERDKRAQQVGEANSTFMAGAGRLFLVKHKGEREGKVILMDVYKGVEIRSLDLRVKRIVMSPDKRYIACIGENRITICDGMLNILSKTKEARKIKSAAWDETGVLIYSTPVHIRYVLTNGDATTLFSVNEVLYVMAVRDSKVFCMNRTGVLKIIAIDSREFKFKQAVIKGDRGAMFQSLRTLGTLTRAEISFIVKKGYPGLALKFVEDHETRFPLALEASNIDEALKSAIVIEDKKCWKKLAEHAMRVGHLEAIEQSYKKLRWPHKLAMLYIVADQRDKLLEARTMAQEIGDTSTEFIISLVIKDFLACAKILRKYSHATLAYTFAMNHGLTELASEIAQELSEEKLDKLQRYISDKDWLAESIPNIGNSPFKNVPVLNEEQDDYEAALAPESGDEMEVEEGGDWDDEDDEPKVLEDQDEDEASPPASEVQEDGWADDEPLEDLIDDEDEEVVETTKEFTAPSVGQSLTSRWTQISDLPLHHVLAGSYKTAYGFMQSQVGVINPEPFKEIFKDLLIQSRAAYSILALHAPLYTFPNSFDFVVDDVPLPSGGYQIEDLDKKLTECHALFSGGKFADAMEQFKTLLLSTMFLQVYVQHSPDALDERETRAKEIISICREHILALQVWLERRSITGKEFENHKRVCELAAYFARLNLSTRHRSKVLEKAFEVFLVKGREDFQKTKTAASIARRLLDHLNPDDPKKSKIISHAQKVKSAYDAQVDHRLQLDYDDLNSYSLCAATFKPIYKADQSVECPLCAAKYKPEFSGTLCKVCSVSEVGKSCSGIKFQLNAI